MNLQSPSDKHIFVTGTGTNIGKTLVSASLCHAWVQKGRAAYWKPVQTGGYSVDRDFVKRCIPSPNLKFYPEVYTYDLPLAPNQAARLTGRESVNVDKLICAFDECDRNIPTVIEGAGGLEVPLNEEAENWLDFLARTQSNVLLVASSGLGTLNHSILSFEALHRQGCLLIGLVLVGEKNPENLTDLRQIYGKRYGGELPIHHFDFATDQNIEEQVKVGSNELAAFFEEASRLKAQRILKIQSQAMADDRQHVWHPYTQHLLPSKPVLLQRANGVWLTDKNGKKYIDGISSWWVNTVGHGRPEINRAIAQQQSEMDHVIFAGATHRPAATLARKISAMTDGAFSRVFFSDNGSTAVEVALKIAYQRWHNLDQPKRQNFLGLHGSYHGDTFGAMSVASADGFHGTFAPFLFKGINVAPVTSHQSHFNQADREESLAQVRYLLLERHEEIAAAIIEPLVQGAGGMLMQDETWLKSYVELLREFQIPIIFDEVFTGLGRLGADFAFKRLGVSPDIVCLAKGLTGGTMPLALTLAREEFFESFLDERKSAALLHGHSYTANPIACAAALAALEIYENEKLAMRALEHEKAFEAWVREMSVAGLIVHPRVKGAILAFELVGSGVSDYFATAGQRFAEVAMQKGLFLRPLGNTVYFAPPLSLSDDERKFALNVLGDCLKRSLPAHT